MASETLGRFLWYIRQVHGASQASDAQLLERFANRREEQAFVALVRRHGPLVLGVCRRVLHDDHESEDAFQATFLALARRAGSIRRAFRAGYTAWPCGWLSGREQSLPGAANMRERRR